MKYSTRLAAAAVLISGLLVLAHCRDATAPTGGDSSQPELSSSSKRLARSGKWGSTFSWPIVAVHLHVLPNGQVLSWGKVGSPQLWDPASGRFTTRSSPSLVFCAGATFLADGRLFVAGGHASDTHGLANTNIYDFATASWQAVAPMAYARWYPTTTTLPDGSVLTLAGTDQNGLVVPTPELWSSGAWRQLTTATQSLDWYPRTFVAPDGRVFYAGEDQPSRWLSTAGTGAWSTGPARLVADRNYGAAVMYAPGKILYVGGGNTPTRGAETIDLNQSAPTWRATGSMSYARRHLNATVLPTGDVLVTSGVSGSGFNNLSTAVYAAELWSPATGTWTTLASAAVPRGYHATAVLLPDARVLVSGSGDASGAVDQRNAQLFSPPYLFKGTQPAISSAPTRVSYGQSFTVSTAQASAIANVVLIRLGAATHAFDESQLYVPLAFTRGSGTLAAVAPANGTIAPPGVYMLFLVDGNGIPSVARMVTVG
ncbi:MAG TPA: galactose oxidase-like domain-containing protein [Gemmatimonadales bacterium]|nr:galactose oxidase-like domain-containing protein [Gemmatimonadales bacterium]